MLRAFYTFLFLVLFSSMALATHNRAGEIIYSHKGGSSLTYEITIITYTESASLADRDSLTLNVYYCGDDDPISSFIVYRNGNITPFPNLSGVQENRYIHDAYTFPGPGCYRLEMVDPNRIADIINIPQSVNVPFALEDTLLIGDPQFEGYNSSPVLLENPIVFACAKDTFFYNSAAFDPDGDSLAYELIVPIERSGFPVQGYKYPDDPTFNNMGGLPRNFSMDPVTGDIVWAVPQTAGTYNIAFIVRDYREGKLMGTMIRDMQIIVTNDCDNGPPEITELPDTCIVAGSLLLADVFGTDPDLTQTLTLTANGGPFFVDNSPANFVSTPKVTPVQGRFSWSTNCTHIRPGEYSVVFRVEDNTTLPNNNKQPLFDLFTWNIKVVAPAPTGLTANLQGNQVTLDWDSPYVCEGAENFQGFSVWRKAGCDSLEFDICESTDLAALGYTKVSGGTPIPGYSFVDVIQGTALTYSYRVVAEFAEKVPPPSQFLYNEVSSAASNEACVEIRTDLPLLTNVDVVTTDVAAGAIDVKWVGPDPSELDTIDNPGPYKYELYRHTGFSPGTGTIQIATFSASSFAGILLEDEFSDSGLNTEGTPYTYTLKFFATDSQTSQFYEVGESVGASSIYLTTITGGNQVTLNWQESVPWINYEYYVMREQQGNPGVYDTIAKVESSPYVDQGLVNGEEYCYKIRGYGSYFTSSLPEPLINHSQRKCEVPVDTIPPCVPDLTVSNICDGEVKNIEPEDLRNVLTWSNPCLECGDCDVVAYRIYYATSSSDPLSLLATISDPTDTVFIHDNLSSLAGCYAVTAVDSFENESALTNTFCVDNCPLYELPNVFTPNGDGSNDLFTPFLPYFFVDHVEMKIFNRWGNLVYETEDPDINWDGTDQFSGKPVNEGVYYYTCKVYEVRVDGVFPVEKPLSGYIHLIRSK